MRQLIVALTAIACTMFAMPADGFAQASRVAGIIHAGNCSDVGDIIVPLSGSLAPSGNTVGSGDAVPAGSSYSSIPFSLEFLTVAEHVVIVPLPGDSGMLACGEIGGSVSDSGALIMGLRETDRSGVTGIAYLSPDADPSHTLVSLFLSGDELMLLSTSRPRTSNVAVASDPLQAIARDESGAENAARQNELTASEQTYIDAVLGITGTMSDSFDQFASLMETPQFGDESWSVDVALQFVTWQISYEEASALTPPPLFADVHGLFVEALRLYAEAGSDAATGIDTFDVDLINQAVGKMEQANDLLAQARAEIDRINQERAG